jgi:P-type Mg2+ transporter
MFAPPLWAQSLEQVLAAAGTARGLSSAEAAARLETGGPNELAAPRRFAALRELLRYLGNPLVLILLVASVISGVFGQVVSAVVIVLMIVLSVALNFTQAYRSQRAAERLQRQVGQTATVIRDGVERELPTRELVVGDLVHLKAGDLVPADCRLLSTRNLFVNEAALTGESLPREKQAIAEALPPGGGLGDAVTAVFRGTSVISGLASAVVVVTGPATQFGRVAASLAGRPPETEFERGTRRFGLLILQVVIFLVLFAFLVNALLRRDLLESFLFSVALAVGLTPELLPMIVSVTLASGAVRMAGKKVIVKRLAAIENFGSMDILCSDKTGTLTHGEITVDHHLNIDGESDETVIRLAALNSVYQTGLRSPMDDAILKHEHPAVAGYARVDEIPFDFQRRRVSVILREEGGRRLLITKGAPESVLPVCAALELGGAARPLDERTRVTAEALFHRLSASGYRVLAVAYRPVAEGSGYTTIDERDLVFVGFAAFLDPPFEGVAETLRALRADGIEVKIVTGDNELVTRRICEQVGLEAGVIVLGEDVERMSDPALGAVAERSAVFARVSPIQKNRIVRALRARGHVVGCVGDGINDALRYARPTWASRCRARWTWPATPPTSSCSRSASRCSTTGSSRGGGALATS